MSRVVLCLLSAVVLSMALAADLFADIAPFPRLTCDVVEVPTSDGLKLSGDLCRARGTGGPVVILLHMIPPHHDRTNYPEDFRLMLAETGMTVLSIDRRGAGKSGGVAKEAYTGPKGKLDVAAALAFLAERADTAPSQWGCVGASNGTTSCLDFAIHAAATEGVTPPQAMVFMTGGSYTETNNKLAGSAATSVPILFTYDAGEAEWSVAQKDLGGTGWAWRMYEPGGHGTKVFGTNPGAKGDIMRFLVEHLSGP